MKVYVICDIEGVAGVCDQIHQCSFVHDSYEKEYVAGSYWSTPRCSRWPRSRRGR